MPSKSNRRTLNKSFVMDENMWTVETQPEVLSNDDPMLGEGAGDPVLDGVLVDRSKVDVGSRALLLLRMEVWWWSLTKTCLP